MTEEQIETTPIKHRTVLSPEFDRRNPLHHAPAFDQKIKEIKTATARHEETSKDKLPLTVRLDYLQELLIADKLDVANQKDRFLKSDAAEPALLRTIGLLTKARTFFEKHPHKHTYTENNNNLTQQQANKQYQQLMPFNTETEQTYLSELQDCLTHLKEATDSRMTDEINKDRIALTEYILTKRKRYEAQIENLPDSQDKYKKRVALSQNIATCDDLILALDEHHPRGAIAAYQERAGIKS